MRRSLVRGRQWSNAMVLAPHSHGSVVHAIAIRLFEGRKMGVLLRLWYV